MGGGGTSAAARQARADAEHRSSQIAEGTEAINKSFGRFNDSFYDNQRRAYLDYATPQVTDQFEKASGKTLAHLARTGQINSSAGANKMADLMKARDLRFGEVQSKAEDVANQSRARINQEKRGLLSALNASADASQATALAAQSANALTALPAFNPIGDAFANFTAIGAIDADAKRNGYPGLFRKKQGGGDSHDIIN